MKEHPIVTYRRKHGLSQTQFGEPYGACRQLVSKWENMENFPRPHTMMKMARLSAGELTPAVLMAFKWGGKK
ncbi:MAG: helix-turn-helix transcriptional regulator [Patescibacteria group bacterium]|nr:helix-turn-helix transcriptional regulator [Patescibacteria group bacterium]